ncbi:Beta-1,2-xylosyltransferase [Lachnellula suecica]|uniref:Beta-1,2-xylosyltransferase n=1 Tax=Lachnellula suecica TaxID=602035 RepID=A0A8T9C6F0_9HELO|nr:Beta-1,2-xylosyltransferase [Lachnellula suecica]
MSVGQSRARAPSGAHHQPFSRVSMSQDDRLYIHDEEEIKAHSFNTVLMRTRRRMRSRQFLLLLALLAVAGLSLLYFRNPSLPARKPPAPHSPVLDGNPKPIAVPPIDATKARTPASHPVWQLISDAEKDYRATLERQSKTLEEAVAEYRRRYGIPPPPNFDKWYEFAKKKNVQLIDEYDSIQQSLTPFWGLKPKTIRKRAQEALGYDANNLIGVLIRSGAVKKIDGGGKWQMEATEGMMKGFIKDLPDMDLCFNIHDEPRVVVPFDDMTRLMKTAVDVKKPAAMAVEAPRNSWSKRPADLSDGWQFEDIRKTRFNVYAHQPTWTESRISCPPDSPARLDLEDGPKRDNYTSYSTGELGFIFNQTAFSDICQSPSFSETFGFFERPNSFNVVHDLFPVFSQSKISSYSDILYPSPWYWYGKVPYSDADDMDWTAKEDKFWWRGSTTGGFSRDGGWRRQHRQHVVQKVNAGGQAKILINRGEGNDEDWQVKEVPRSDFKEIFDIYFSHVGQCDPGDCDAQREFFTVKPTAEQTDAWKYKYLLDMDGNAFSGRFYAFLKSRSLVYKLAVFREWHNEWLRPWVHFIPLSLRGDEWVEALRWFAGEPTGKKEAERLALQGREWAGKVLRNEDLEVWFFRLLLEYGRLVDDDREIIGYTGPEAKPNKDVKM